MCWSRAQAAVAFQWNFSDSSHNFLVETSIYSPTLPLTFFYKVMSLSVISDPILFYFLMSSTYPGCFPPQKNWREITKYSLNLRSEENWVIVIYMEDMNKKKRQSLQMCIWIHAGVFEETFFDPVMQYGIHLG